MDISSLNIIVKLLVVWILFFINSNFKINWVHTSFIIVVQVLLTSYLKVPLPLISLLGNYLYQHYVFKVTDRQTVIYYSCFPIVFQNLLSRLIIMFIFPFMGQLQVNDLLANNFFIILSNILVIPTFEILTKIFLLESFDFRYQSSPVVSNFLKITNSILLIYICIIPFLNGFDTKNVGLRKIVLMVSFFILIYLVSYISHYYRQNIINQIKGEESQVYSLLENYNQFIESIYRDIRSFRHDYDNMLISLAGTLNVKDFSSAQLVINQVLMRLDAIHTYSRSKELRQLNKINIFEIRLLIALKINDALSKKIPITYEISDNMNHIPINLSDFIVILSSLFDLVIEFSYLNQKSPIRFHYKIDIEKQLQFHFTCQKAEKMSNQFDDYTDSLNQFYLLMNYFKNLYPVLDYTIQEEKNSNTFHLRIYQNENYQLGGI